MGPSAHGRSLTPSKVSAWLDCAHFLTLRNEVETGLRGEPKPAVGSFAQLVMDKGDLRERECLARYKAEGLSVFEVPPRDTTGRESFEAWVGRVGNPFEAGHDVVFQMPFVHDGMRGVADFLERHEDDDTGEVHYEPVDAKLARKEAKPATSCSSASTPMPMSVDRPEAQEPAPVVGIG